MPLDIVFIYIDYIDSRFIPLYLSYINIPSYIIYLHTHTYIYIYLIPQHHPQPFPETQCVSPSFTSLSATGGDHAGLLGLAGSVGPDFLKPQDDGEIRRA